MREKKWEKLCKEMREKCLFVDFGRLNIGTCLILLEIGALILVLSKTSTTFFHQMSISISQNLYK